MRSRPAGWEAAVRATCAPNARTARAVWPGDERREPVARIGGGVTRRVGLPRDRRARAKCPLFVVSRRGGCGGRGFRGGTLLPEFVEKRVDIVTDVIGPRLGIRHESVARAPSLTVYARCREVADERIHLADCTFELVRELSPRVRPPFRSKHHPERKTHGPTSERAPDSNVRGASTGFVVHE